MGRCAFGLVAGPRMELALGGLPERRPFDHAQDSPFDFAQDSPFDHAQDSQAFGLQSAVPFDFAQDYPRPRPNGSPLLPKGYGLGSGGYLIASAALIRSCPFRSFVMASARSPW